MRLAEAFEVRPRDVVAIVGGGGKTTLMFRLAAELAVAGWRVVTTTSTRLAASETRLPPVCLAQADGQARLAELRLALRRSRHVLAVREIVPELDLAGGLPLAEIEQIAALPEVDALIVEADGSRKRPLKAPAVYEPVMPGCATLVIPVVGLDVLGCPLTDDFVHRPQLVANLAGVALGQPITETIVSAVIGSQQGGAARRTGRAFLEQSGEPGEATSCPCHRRDASAEALDRARRRGGRGRARPGAGHLATVRALAAGGPGRWGLRCRAGRAGGRLPGRHALNQGAVRGSGDAEREVFSWSRRNRGRAGRGRRGPAALAMPRRAEPLRPPIDVNG